MMLSSPLMPGFETDPEADNWRQWQVFLDHGKYKRNTPLPRVFRRKPWRPLPPSRHSITVDSAKEAYQNVLDDVGCNARLDENGRFVSIQDELDKLYIRWTKEGTGPKKYRDPWTEIPYPKINPGKAYADTDRDGMADAWERKQFGGLNVARYGDKTKTDNDGDGLRDLDEFLNGTNPKEP